MTAVEIKRVVSHLLGVPESSISVSRTHTEVSGSMTVNYDVLAHLAKELGTTDINFVYAEGEPGYSSWTPGTDGSFSFTIGIGAAP